MNDEQLNAAIAALPHDKVTKEGIEARIKSASYLVLPGTTVTICHLELVNGFSVRGESACADKRNFNMKIGEELAYRDAFGQMWKLEGYLLCERKHLASLAK